MLASRISALDRRCCADEGSVDCAFLHDSRASRMLRRFSRYAKYCSFPIEVSSMTRRTSLADAMLSRASAKSCSGFALSRIFLITTSRRPSLIDRACSSLLSRSKHGCVGISASVYEILQVGCQYTKCPPQTRETAAKLTRSSMRSPHAHGATLRSSTSSAVAFTTRRCCSRIPYGGSETIASKNPRLRWRAIAGANARQATLKLSRAASAAGSP
mmetsp:Transcript_24944/g.77095  ORF Transcript_24944/g.77095 Transcript_24944/m.77095 type:complete len:215 (-) Transcript_24944:986-1630(-)